MSSPPWLQIHILMEVGKHSFYGGLIKVPCHNENSLWMCKLQFTDGVLQNIQGLKGMSRLNFLRKLRYLNVCSKMLGIFYQSMVACVAYFFLLWFVGGVASEQATPIDSINSLRRLAL